MALAPGTRLGPYEVVAPIGKGGMGDVYRARDTRVHREVAIKTSSERFSDRFEREAQAIAALNHPNVCTLYDVGSDYLVMELVEGPTLADRIAKGAIPLDESLKLAAQIADALSAAHRKGVIHRDLKPGNIKIKPDGTVKVLDFGLAKVTESLGPPDQDAADALSHSPTLTTPAMTQAGVVLGTAAYMSPEQAKGKPVDKTSDIWAFGVVLYEMLTGKQLHQGETVSDTLASVLKDAPDLNRVPTRVRRLLRSCLQKDRDQRLHEIVDWKLLLDDDTAQTVSESGTRSRWMWPAIAALLLVIAAAALSLLLFRAKPLAPPEVRSQIPQPEGLTFNPGTQAAISPDGKWLAFPAQGPDNVSRMYVRSIDSLDVRALPGSEGILLLSPPPFWSDDSRFIAYGAQGKLKKSEITGTPAQTITETGRQFVQGGTWNRDGIIVYARPNDRFEQVSSNGGAPSPVTALTSGETAHRWPQFLPDGRRFLYLRVSRSPDRTGMYVGSLDIKPEEQSQSPLLLTNRQAWWVSSETSGRSYLLMQRDEALFAQPFDTNTATVSGTAVPVASGVGSFAQATSGLWSVARNGALVYRAGGAGLPQPTWLDPAGRVVGTAGDPGVFTGSAISPDGNRLAFSAADSTGNQDVWVRDLGRGNVTRLTFDPRPDNGPVWSPDGKRVIYAANRGGRLDLYDKNADGSGEERLVLQSDQDKGPTSWSRDGRFLLFISTDPKTREDLWILPLDGDRKPFPFLNTDAQEQFGQFSPDQRWIAYGALTAASLEVFVRPFTPDSRSAATASGPVWMVSTNGGIAARWSADGRRLYYTTSNGEMMAVDIQAGVTFQSGVPQRLFNAQALGQWNLSPGGDRFLVMRPSASSGPPPPFTMVLNWMTKLEQ
jgi:eukaryotic-like serine/threonine-protein kinase